MGVVQPLVGMECPAPLPSPPRRLRAGQPYGPAERPDLPTRESRPHCRGTAASTARPRRRNTARGRRTARASQALSPTRLACAGASKAWADRTQDRRNSRARTRVSPRCRSRRTAASPARSTPVLQWRSAGKTPPASVPRRGRGRCELGLGVFQTSLATARACRPSARRQAPAQSGPGVGWVGRVCPQRAGGMSTHSRRAEHRRALPIAGQSTQNSGEP